MEIDLEKGIVQANFSLTFEVEVEAGTELFRLLESLYQSQEHASGLLNKWGFSGKVVVVERALRAIGNQMTASFTMRSVT